MPGGKFEIIHGEHHEPSPKGIKIKTAGETTTSDLDLDKMFVGKFKKVSSKTRPMMSEAGEFYNEGDPVLGTFDKRHPRTEKAVNRPRPKRPIQSEDVDEEEDDRLDEEERTRDTKPPKKVAAKAAKNRAAQEDDEEEDEDLVEEEDEDAEEEDADEEESDEEDDDEDAEEEEEDEGEDVTSKFAEAKKAKLNVVRRDSGPNKGFNVMKGDKPVNKKPLKSAAEAKTFLKDYLKK